MKINWEKLNSFEMNFGNSFYILNSSRFKNNYKDFLNSFRKIYPKTYIAYSYKTNYIPKLCSIIKDLNGYAEVVSEMEYDLAKRIGVKPEKIIVNGPYKNRVFLEKCLLEGTLVNLDSFYEIKIIKTIAKKYPNKNLSIGFRCNFIIDNSLNSRFGFDVTDKKFLKNLKDLQSIKNIVIKGVHCHYPNRDITSFNLRINKLFEITKNLFPIPPEFIDLGGGFSGKMSEELKEQFNYKVPSYFDYANLIARKFSETFKQYDFDNKPKLFLEPGTAIVADVMKFVVKVLDVKNLRGEYIAITTGSKFNLGSFSSTINLPMQVISKNSKRGKYYKNINISGYTCIESDFLYRNYKGYLNILDYIVFNNVGSYSFVFKPPFILPNVAIIEYNSQKRNCKLIKRAETFDDIFGAFV